jgi:hypothetical protein
MVSVCFFVSSAQAMMMPWSDWQDDFTVKKQVFEGRWADQQRWDGTFCDGVSYYDGRLKGKVEKVNFENTTANKLDVYADISQLSGSILGEYLSEYSLCLPLRGSYGLTVDRFELFADVTFVERNERELPDIKVKVRETRFTGIHLIQGVPRFIEEAITNWVNRAVKMVWSSDFGDWLSQKITEEIKTKFPKKN